MTGVPDIQTLGPVSWVVSDLNARDIALEPAQPSERARAERFKRADDRDHFLHTRHIARHLVSAVTGSSVSELVFDDPHGEQPHLASMPDVWISWSRSGPCSIAAMTRTGRVAVDVERISPIAMASMLDMVATPAEREAVLEAGISEQQQLTRFFRLWTAKEAILKLRGTGLRGDAKSVELSADILKGDTASVGYVDGDQTVTLDFPNVPDGLCVCIAQQT